MHMARYGRNSRDPRVTLVRAHSYLTDNAIIDEYGPKIGAYGLAVYHALNRFADRQTGICWPKIKTIGARILLSESSVKRALHTLKKVGLITIDPRWSDDGDRTSNLFTLIPLATIAKREQAAADIEISPPAQTMDGGGFSADPPPITETGEVGSAGTLSEQEPENKISSHESDGTENATTRNTCSHPANEVSRFAGMTICYHCWSLLPERDVIPDHQASQYAEEIGEPLVV
jgi:GntR family transcriptional regulator